MTIWKRPGSGVSAAEISDFVPVVCFQSTTALAVFEPPLATQQSGFTAGLGWELGGIGVYGDYVDSRTIDAFVYLTWYYTPCETSWTGQLMGDTDSDGCTDLQEQQTGSGAELLGGQRDENNPHDYFNPTKDGLNRIDDVLEVLNQYYADDDDANPGLPPYEPGYNPNTDRTLLGPHAWNTGPPNGLQRIDDVLNSLEQYFHDCW